MKRLPEDALFLEGIQVVDEQGAPLDAALAYEEVLREQPNHKFLGMRLPMQLHLLVREETLETAMEKRAETGKPAGGLRWWLAHRMGEAPVAHDPYLAERSRINLEALARQSGYLNASCEMRVDTSNQRANIHYVLTLGQAWTVHDVRWEAGDSGLNPDLSSYDIQSLQGQKFNVRALDAARAEIAASFRSKGFPTVQASHIAFLADSSTTSVQRTVALTVELLPVDYSSDNVPVEHQFARFGSVTWSCLNNDTKGSPCMSDEVANFLISMDSGMVFNEVALQDTYQRLVALPAVSRVEMPGSLRSDDAGSFAYDMEVGIDLTKRFGASAELQMIRSDARYGPVASLGLTNNNLSGRGDALEISVAGGVVSTRPFSYTSDALVPNSGTWSVQFDYSTLGVSPLPLEKVRPSNQARTTLSANWMREVRPEYAREAATVSYGFHLIENPSRESQITVTPLEFTYSNISRTDEFDAWLSGQANPILTGRFMDYTSLASKFAWQSNWALPSLKGSVRSAAEWTGMGLSALAGPLGLSESSSGAYLLGGIPFAQYVRGELDLTVQKRLSSEASFNGRFKLGLAGTGDNMEALPFDRAFYAGGANGVRGWSVRDLGPGFAQQEVLDAGFVPGVGDMQLEWSLEYRRTLTDAFGIAWFSDAGNVWVHGNTDGVNSSESQFAWSSIAWGGGIGMRLDFEFFLLRLDAALRLYDPSQTANNRWVKLNSPKGMVHLGIGHPF